MFRKNWAQPLLENQIIEISWFYYRGSFKNKKGSQTSFQITVSVEIIDKNVSFVIRHKLTKFLQQTVLISQDTH